MPRGRPARSAIRWLPGLRAAGRSAVDRHARARRRSHDQRPVRPVRGRPCRRGAGRLGGFEKPAAGSPLAGALCGDGPLDQQLEPFGVLGRMHAAEEIETGVEPTTSFLVGQSARGVSRCLATPDERPVELARSRRLDVMPRDVAGRDGLPARSEVLESTGGAAMAGQPPHLRQPGVQLLAHHRVGELEAHLLRCLLAQQLVRTRLSSSVHVSSIDHSSTCWIAGRSNSLPRTAAASSSSMPSGGSRSTRLSTNPAMSGPPGSSVAPSFAPR